MWGTGLGNQYGHIAIATGEGDTHQFYSYDLNWGQKVVHKVLHNYKGFLGVLRACNQDLITGVRKEFKKGVVYTSQVILKVRYEAGLDKEQVPFENLSENAKLHAFSDGVNKGCLKAQTYMTCLDSKIVDNNTWIKIPSGWVCAIFEGKDYIK